ncbi:hypothetical protein WBJ53_01005 [Spirosoma sp. SC4-14]|uniref:hypothetical protein n=1 Tax=Spirosoma sp. SC4-14 TaxID=3128900 RepID=UPI0030CE8815
MKKYILSIISCFVLIGFLADCQDAYKDFSPGAGDPRIVGTWQLIERRYPADSMLYTLNINYSTVIVGQREVKVIRDTTISSRDTSFYATRVYAPTIPQTLSFEADGKLTATGDQMTYYNPIKYYKVDSTYQDGLGVNLYISTNRANQYFRQGVAFGRDTLLLQPRCEDNCYLKLVRVR